MVNVIPITDTETIKALFEVSSIEQQEDTYLVLATRRGQINKVRLSAVGNIRPSGLIMMNLKDDDELVSVRIASDEEDVVIVSEQGMSVRFGVDQIPERNRGTMGCPRHAPSHQRQPAPQGKPSPKGRRQGGLHGRRRARQQAAGHQQAGLRQGDPPQQVRAPEPRAASASRPSA